MFRNAYQRGLITVFYSGGANPLDLWEARTQNGYISRFLDQDIKALVYEIGGTNVSTSYLTCPKGNQVLGIAMPFLVMIVKNLKKYFSFEITIIDASKTRRRFRASNFNSSTQINPLCTSMPLALSDGWNQIQFNLAEFTRRAYNQQFVEVEKLKVNANIRLRRIYFTESLLSEDELPPEYKLYFPLDPKRKSMDKGKENIQKQLVTETPTDVIRESAANIKLASKTPIKPRIGRKTKPSLASEAAVPMEEETAAENETSDGKASIVDEIATLSLADPVAAELSEPGDRSEQSVPRDQSEQSVPRDRSEQSVPRDLSEQSVPRDQSEQSVPRGLSEQSVLRNRAEQSVPRYRSEQSVPRDRSEQSVPRDRSEQSVPRDRSEQSLPRDRSEQSVPRDRSEQSVPRDRSEQSVPRDRSEHSVPGERSELLELSQRSELLVPGDRSEPSELGPRSEPSEPSERSELLSENEATRDFEYTADN